MRSKLTGVRRGVAKLLGANAVSGRTAAGDRWWRAVLRQEALLDAVERRIEAIQSATDVMRTDLPPAAFVVVVKEAERLGIAASAEVAGALLRFRRAASIADFASRRAETWTESEPWRRDAEKASAAALAVLLTAEGAVWPGRLPQRPPGDPAPEDLPQWVRELTEAELVALNAAFALTDSELVDWADELGIPEEEQCPMA